MWTGNTSTKTMVIVLEEVGGTRGEVTTFEHAQNAGRFVDDLLAKGFDQRAIRVIWGRDLDLLVTKAPVVALLADGGPSRMASPPAMRTAIEITATCLPTYGEEPTESVNQESRRELAAASSGTGSEPYTRNGIRFSSAFARPN